MKPENDMTNGSNALARKKRGVARRVRRERLKKGFIYFLIQTFIFAYTPHAYAGPEGGEVIRGNGNITMPDTNTTFSGAVPISANAFCTPLRMA